MENGKPVDIVLNPLGVPSRMNVGQILETHLGWSCSELGDQIKNYLKNFDKEIEKIKDKLKEIYGKNYYDKIVSKLSNKEIAELVQNLSNGVPIATPVFDGASTEDITKMLDLAKLLILAKLIYGMVKQVKDLIDPSSSRNNLYA